MRQPSLDELRVNGRGRYLPLKAGLTHVIEEGQDDQAAILLVHGDADEVVSVQSLPHCPAILALTKHLGPKGIGHEKRTPLDEIRNRRKR